MYTKIDSATTDCSQVPPNDQRQPKPPVVLVVCGLSVIGTSILLVSTAISLLAATWNFGYLISGVIILPPSAIVLLQQYRGLFCGKVGAANVAGIILFVIGGLALFVCGALFFEMVFEPGGIQVSWLWLLIPFLSVGLFSCFTGWLNLRWARQLNQYALSTSHPVRASSLSRRDLLAGVVILACIAGLATYFIQTTTPRCAEHVSVDEAPFGLPSTATDVSFCQGQRGTIAYEFTIDEVGFVDWVESGIGPPISDEANVPPKPIEKPYKIETYRGFTGFSGPNSITIENGLYYDWCEGDCGVHAAFDRSTGRAYCFKHFH